MIIVALMMAVLFMPLADIRFGEILCSMDSTGITSAEDLLYPTWGLFIVIAAIALIALVTIFLFRKRILQIRLCIFNAILMVGFYVLFGYYLWKSQDLAGDSSDFRLKIAITFPFISIIIDYLAIRNIGADEALVRSLERLR